MGTTSSKSRTNARRDDAMMRERTDDADAARAPPTPTRKCKAKTKDTLLNAKDATTKTTKTTPCPYVVDIAKLYAHDARLERAVCAVAIVRQSIGEFVEDTNFWLARALARDATKKYSRDVESRVRDAITARETQLFNYVQQQHRKHTQDADDDTDAAQTIDADDSAPSSAMSRAIRCKDARTFASGVEDVDVQYECDFMEDFANRAMKLHDKAQVTYERRLESCVYEHQKARFKLNEAEARFARLASKVDRGASKADVDAALRRDISATDVDINAQLAQCERFESMLHARCEEYLDFFAPELERLVYAYAVGKISMRERANEDMASAITGANTPVQTLFAKFHAMKEADASAIEAPPSPPKLKAVAVVDVDAEVDEDELQTPMNTPAKGSDDDDDDESIEEGEILDDEKTPRKKQPKQPEAAAFVAA
jgi:hypothetical protein